MSKKSFICFLVLFPLISVVADDNEIMLNCKFSDTREGGFDLIINVKDQTVDFGGFKKVHLGTCDYSDEEYKRCLDEFSSSQIVYSDKYRNGIRNIRTVSRKTGNIKGELYRSNGSFWSEKDGKCVVKQMQGF
ncbi:MAG: hypothetical protein WC680_10100 [Sulfuricurvum sp.]|jgi:hypothetical protein